MMNISAIVITKNEEKLLPQCLRSLRWVSEIIVVDQDSTDSTTEIARAAGAKVFNEPNWQGFGKQKSKALGYATGEWVLSIDADESVTPDLAMEIQQMISSGTSFRGFEIPRLSSYCGRVIRHSGWWPDYVLRFFRRDAGHFTDDLVHEQVIIDGEVGRLNNTLLHTPFSNLEMVLNKINHYSTLGAVGMEQKGSSSGLFRALAHGLAAFFRTYFLKAGFLDGREGFILAISNAEGTYYKYLKLMYLNELRK